MLPTVNVEVKLWGVNLVHSDLCLQFHDLGLEE